MAETPKSVISAEEEPTQPGVLGDEEEKLLCIDCKESVGKSESVRWSYTNAKDERMWYCRCRPCNIGSRRMNYVMKGNIVAKEQWQRFDANQKKEFLNKKIKIH